MHVLRSHRSIAFSLLSSLFAIAFVIQLRFFKCNPTSILGDAARDHRVRRLIIEPIVARFARPPHAPASRPSGLPLDGHLDGAANTSTVPPLSVAFSSRISTVRCTVRNALSSRNTSPHKTSSAQPLHRVFCLGIGGVPLCSKEREVREIGGEVTSEVRVNREAVGVEIASRNFGCKRRTRIC